MINVSLGRMKFVDQGTWINTTDYIVDDVVDYLGSNYICIQANVDIDPVTGLGTSWQKLSEAFDPATNYRDDTDGVKRFKMLSDHNNRRQFTGVTFDDKVYVRGEITSEYIGGCSYQGITAGRWRNINFPAERFGKEIIDVKTSFRTCYVLFADGELWGWGGNTYGQLGDSTTTNQYKPLKILGNIKDFKTVNTGHTDSYVSTVARDNNDQLWSWGYNNFGQLGLGHNTANVTTPTQVLDGDSVADYSIEGTHYAHMGVVKDNGNLWMCGQNATGQLGMGNTTSYNRLQRIVFFDGIAEKVHCASCYYGQNWGYTWVVTTAGEIWGSGYNSQGQFADGTTTQRTSFVKMVHDFATYPIKKVYFRRGGHGTGHYIDIYDNLWFWGYNGYGQGGDGTTTDRLYPVKIYEGAQDIWHTITGYNSHYQGAYMRTLDNKLFAWGYNQNGSLGILHATVNNPQMTEVHVPFDIRKIKQHVNLGYATTAWYMSNVFLDEYGYVYGCGYNAQSQIWGEDMGAGEWYHFANIDR